MTTQSAPASAAVSTATSARPALTSADPLAVGSVKLWREQSGAGREMVAVTDRARA
jgi:hypothetical protein